MRKGCVVLIALLATFPSQHLSADPPTPTPSIGDLEQLAVNKEAELEARVRAIDSIGREGAVASVAPDAVKALHNILTAISSSKPSKSRLLGHVVQAFAQTGAYAIAEVSSIEALAGIDKFLDAEIDSSVATIEQAAAKPAPAGNPNGGNNPSPGQATPPPVPPPSILPSAEFDALWKTIAGEKDQVGLLKDLVAALNNSKSSPELLRCVLGLAKAVAKLQPPSGLADYLTALGGLVNGKDVGVAIAAAYDLGDLGTQSSVFYLEKAASAPNQDPNLKAVAEAAVQSIIKRNPKNGTNGS
jgi:hypothetical protein